MLNFFLTREQLEQRLIDLDKTADGFSPVGVFAMCYMVEFREPFEPAEVTCEGCGRAFGDENVPSKKSVRRYRQVIRQYRLRGYDAHIWFFCDDCIEEKSLPTLPPVRFPFPDEERHPHTNMFFAFKARGDKEYHVVPIGDGGTDIDELSVALDFLKGAKSYHELDKEYGTRSLFRDADGFRRCIERVLGLDIEKHRQEGNSDGADDGQE